MVVRSPSVSPDIEVWREEVRRRPDVIVHRPIRRTTFVPDIFVINVRHMDELLGYDDEDDDRDGADPA